MNALPAPTAARHHFSVRTAAGDVERSWQRVTDARDAFSTSTRGDTDALFELQSAWTEAIADYETARLRLQTAVAQAHGEAWLTALGVCGG